MSLSLQEKKSKNTNQTRSSIGSATLIKVHRNSQENDAPSLSSDEGSSWDVEEVRPSTGSTKSTEVSLNLHQNHTVALL